MCSVRLSRPTKAAIAAITWPHSFPIPAEGPVAVLAQQPQGETEQHQTDGRVELYDGLPRYDALQDGNLKRQPNQRQKSDGNRKEAGKTDEETQVPAPPEDPAARSGAFQRKC